MLKEGKINNFESVDQAAEIKEPHFISSRLLEALGGKKISTPAGELVDKGAYLWGVEDRELGGGILKHVLLASRLGYYVSKLLKEKDLPKYKELNLRYAVEAVILHDIAKLYGEQREKLPPELKEAIGLRKDFKEESLESDEAAASWIKDLGFPPEVCEAIQTEMNLDKGRRRPYSQIVILADHMASQKIMTVDERMADVKYRWIDKPIAEGKEPRASLEHFEKELEIARQARDEIFGCLGISDKEFIEKYKLNSPESQTRWEKFLLKTRQTGREERAKHLVRHFIK